MGNLPSNPFFTLAARWGKRAGEFLILLIFGLMQAYPAPVLAASLELSQSQSYQRFLHYVATHEGAVLGAQSDSETEDAKTFVVTVSAYTSTAAETDSTPFITASGETTRWQVAAANWLPFGTRFRMGGQTFVVHDRMNARFTGQRRVDIWMPNRDDAITFGVRTMEMKIVSSP